MCKFATKIVSRQNRVNQYFGILFGVLGVLFGRFSILVGVLGDCGIGMLYFLHLEFGLVYLIFSSQKMYIFGFLFSE